MGGGEGKRDTGVPLCQTPWLGSGIVLANDLRVSLCIAARRSFLPTSWSGVLSLSGAGLPRASALPVAPQSLSTAIALLHGDADTLVPPARILAAEAALKAFGCTNVGAAGWLACRACCVCCVWFVASQHTLKSADARAVHYSYSVRELQNCAPLTVPRCINHALCALYPYTRVTGGMVRLCGLCSGEADHVPALGALCQRQGAL